MKTFLKSSDKSAEYFSELEKKGNGHQEGNQAVVSDWTSTAMLSLGLAGALCQG